MLRFTLGNAYWKEKKFPQAVQHLEKALEFNADYSAAWKVLGRCLIEMDELERAQDVLTQGLEVAQKQGDKQTEKEIIVFLKRVNKKLDVTDAMKDQQNPDQ